MSQRCHFYGRRWIFRFLEVMTNDVRNVSWTCHFRVRRWEVKNAVNGGDFSLFMGRSWLVGQEQPAIFCFLFWAAIYPILPFVDRSSLSPLSRLPSLSLSPWPRLPLDRSLPPTTPPLDNSPTRPLRVMKMTRFWRLSDIIQHLFTSTLYPSVMKMTSFWHHSKSLKNLPGVSWKWHVSDTFMTSFQKTSKIPMI